MSVLLGTLCLGEMQWLPMLWEQHRDWPGLAKWVFVESADVEYARVNPDHVSPEGLSVDGTTEFLEGLAERDPRVIHIRHGFSSHRDPAVGKAAARQRYLDVAEEVRPEYVLAVDADEFYTREDQAKLLQVMDERRSYRAFTFPRREIWRPPCWADRPLFDCEVVGGFWQIPCGHWFRWSPGMHYADCHNTPVDARGRHLNNRLLHLHDKADTPGLPQMVHLGFAAKLESRVAKHRYYAGRGEDRDRQRKWYVHSRAAWETWQPGEELPRGAKVIPYQGPVPEVFRAPA